MGTPPAEHRYRFQWTFPVFYSRWDPRELWIAGNRIFRSRRRGTELGGREPGPHAERSGEARALGRPDHARQHRRRGVLHDLRARRVAARARRAVGGHRRRPRPPLARPRPHVAGGDAAGSARVGARQRARAVAARRGDLLRRGHALQARRHAPLSLQDERLRPHVEAHHGEPAGRRDHARRPRGPEPARTALLRHRDRRVGLARRRRRVAAAPREPARGADPRSDRQGHGPGRGHARALVLDPRRPHAAPPDGRRRRGRRRAPLRAAPGRALARLPRPRHEARAEPRGRVPAGRLDRLRLSPGRVADRREAGAAARRGREPAERRHRPLLAEGGAGRRPHARLPRRRRPRDPVVHEPPPRCSARTRAGGPSPGAGGGEEPRPEQDASLGAPDDEPRPTKNAGANRFVWNLRGPDATKLPDNKGRGGTAEMLAGPRVPPGRTRCGSPWAAGR